MKISKQYLKKIILEELEKQKEDVKQGQIADNEATRAVEGYSKLSAKLNSLKNDDRFKKLPEPDNMDLKDKLHNTALRAAMWNINQTHEDSVLISLFRDNVSNNCWLALEKLYNSQFSIPESNKETVNDMIISIFGDNKDEQGRLMKDRIEHSIRNYPNNIRTKRLIEKYILMINGFDRQEDRVKFHFWSNPPSKYAIQFKSHNKR